MWAFDELITHLSLDVLHYCVEDFLGLIYVKMRILTATTESDSLQDGRMSSHILG